ncbi:hypothetical protein CERSUDRAFT_118144 [Gelatoporia subvermispora B]|uniref:Uncharacterized protein n=1 Tax=Ceriporiopsis subvermispora (strain B) TaxID=914234 RepID=M2R4F3_CERS8|nr:hypothetical protein CERSUDRAFT_118144 [Gelatoporia subvermispora B]
MLSIATAKLLEIFFTTIFLGIHLVTFVKSLWIQLVRRRRRSRKPNWLLVAVTLSMGVIGILDTGISLALSYQVFVVAGGNVSRVTTLSYWMNLVQIFDVNVQPLIGDAMMINRLWVVYGRDWRISAPFVLIWLGNLGVVIMVVYLSIKSHVSSGFNDSIFTPYLAAMLVLTVVNNVLTTSLIVYRLWTATRITRTYIVGQHHLRIFARIVIESGLLCTVTALILLGATVSKSNFDYIVGGSLTQLTGIAFNLIIINVASGTAYGNDDTSLSDLRTVALGTVQNSSDHISSPCNTSPVHIHIAQTTKLNDEESMMNK